jgi:hypothetical protein
VQFSYPLLDSFYFDLDGNGSSDVAPGSCVPWLDRLPGGTPGQGINVTFDLRWPSQVPTLQVGETLMDARNGLPAVQSFAQASILYDDGDPAGTNAQQSVVRLFDPLAERMVPLPSPFVVPSGLATVNDRGRLRFPDLPHALRSRLSIIPSPTQAWLVFSGNVDTSNAGDPLLLPNVITPLERERLQRLTSNAAFQSALDALFDLTRNPGRLDLDRNGSPDRAVLIGLAPSTTQPNLAAHESLGATPKALTAGLGTGTGYVTLVENNDPSLAGLPVALHVLRVEGGPYRGQLQVILPDNIFDERVTLRHSADFAGRPERLEFEWYSHPADGFDPSRLPVLTEAVSELNGWTRLTTAPTSGAGVHELTLGEGSQSGLLTLSDQWYIVRYRGYTIQGATPWSPWAGAPGGDRAQLVEGWVKRVRDGLNPFEARTRDFHASETSTYASMLRQAGERYEGDIAFNPAADNLNRIGLIEAYETVLRRGRQLSIDAPTPINFGPANDALLLAAGTVADLYTLLGNEAFADAADPPSAFPPPALSTARWRLPSSPFRTNSIRCWKRNWPCCGEEMPAQPPSRHPRCTIDSIGISPAAMARSPMPNATNWPISPAPKARRMDSSMNSTRAPPIPRATAMRGAITSPPPPRTMDSCVTRTSPGCHDPNSSRSQACPSRSITLMNAASPGPPRSKPERVPRSRTLPIGAISPTMWPPETAATATRTGSVPGASTIGPDESVRARFSTGSLPTPYCPRSILTPRIREYAASTAPRFANWTRSNPRISRRKVFLTAPTRG